RPKVYAFIDHDLIPLAPFNFSEKVERQPVYGELRAKPATNEWNLWSGRKLADYWSLWAGYCVFDYAATAHYPLDFTPDNPIRLDTGGQNWTRMYREFDRSGMRFATIEWMEVGGTSNTAGARFRRIDDWIHVGGVSYRADSHNRLDVFEDLLAGLQRGGGAEKPA